MTTFETHRLSGLSSGLEKPLKAEAQGIATRYQHIDSIRAIAALLVLWEHTEQLLPAAESSSLYRLLIPTMDFGRIGVFLFFALSGFLIPATLRGCWGEGSTKFILRRFFRLYPAYWISLLFAVLITLLIDKAPLDYGMILANVSMFQKFLGYEPMLGVYWTLSIELIFYGICLLLFIFGVARCPLIFCVIGFASLIAINVFTVALSPLGWFEQDGLVMRLTRIVVSNPLDPWGSFTFLAILALCIMCIGACTRFVFEKQASPATIALIIILILLYIAEFLFLPAELFYRGIFPLQDLRTNLSHSLPLCLFLIFGFVVKIKIRPFVFIGMISYSIYLFHPLFLRLAMMLSELYVANMKQNLPGFIFAAGVLTASLIAAAAGYCFIETPAIAFGRKLSLSRRIPK